MLVGLSGYAQSGKDSVGAILVKEYGFTRYAFADALKEIVYRLNPLVENAGGGPAIRMQDVVDGYGWEVAKKSPEVRRLLQVMGTEAGRQVLGDNIWVDTVLNKVGDDNVVITDCRFPNEAQAVQARSGVVIRVERPGVAAVNAHASETALDSWLYDATIFNTGTLEDLEWVVKDLYERLESSTPDLQLF
jgi:hypothetical protein